MDTESWPYKDTWSLYGNKEIVSRYQILEKIGEGAFADVYRARRLEDNQIVALKEVHDSDSSYREVKVLLLLDHPNVIKLYEYFVQGSNMVLVLEYLPSNLSQVIKAGNLSEADVKGWCIQILRGLSACHAASILHRDIKPANLLIAEDGTLKIADFGTARVLGKDAQVDQYDYGSEVAADEDVAGSSISASEAYGNRDEFASVPSAGAETDLVALNGLNYEPVSTVNAEAQVDQHGLRNQIHSGDAKLPDDCLHPSQESRFDDPEAADTSPTKHTGSRDSDLSGDGRLISSAGDGRGHLGVEKMVRNESVLVGRSLSDPLSAGSQVQDPGCCGWFSSETDVAGLKEAEGRIESQSMAKVDGFFNKEIYLGNRDGDAVSSDESYGSWKDKRGFLDLPVTRENAETAEVGEVSDTKSEGYFLFQRFHKKLSSEEKVELREISSPEHEENPMEEEMAWKEPLKNWPHSSMLSEHSSLTSVFSGPSADEIKTGHEEKPLQVIAVCGHYEGLLASCTDIPMDAMAVTELRDACKDDGIVDESAQGVGMTRSKSPKYVSYGSLREMVYAYGSDGIGRNESVYKDGENRLLYSASKTNPGPSESYAEDEVPQKSKQEGVDGIQKSCKEENLSAFPCHAKVNLEREVAGPLSVDSVGATSLHSTSSKSGAINIHGKGAADFGSGNESGQELGYGSVGSGKVVGTSWDHMVEHACSPSEAEGTRWFGAPNFQDSYMEAGNGDENSSVRVSGETGKVDSEFDEWEDVAEAGAFRERGGSSQGTSDRGANRSQNGSEFTTMVGTRWYRAPELLYGATKYGMEVDIWSFGCIFGELLSGKPLFPGINDIDQLSRLVRILGSPTEREWEGVTLLPDFSKIRFVDDRSPVTLRNHLANISENSLQFLQKILTYDPLRRPTATEAVDDEYFQKEPFPTSPCNLTVPTPEDQNDFCIDDEEWGKCPDSDDTDSTNEWTCALQNQWQSNYATDSDHPLSD